MSELEFIEEKRKKLHAWLDSIIASGEAGSFLFFDEGEYKYDGVPLVLFYDMPHQMTSLIHCIFMTGENAGKTSLSNDIAHKLGLTVEP